MNAAEKEAIQAFYRLHKTMGAIVSDPNHPSAVEVLENVAYEANRTMKVAGLLGTTKTELFAMVKELYSDFNSTQ